MEHGILEKFRRLDMLIAGQALTSRTETIERYYMGKVRYLGVIGIGNPYSIRGLARCTLYKNGELLKEIPLFHVQLRGIYWLNQLLMAPVFFLYGVSMLTTVLRSRKRFDLFIGIACFSTLFGVLLKKLGIVKNVIYYTLDYYPKPAELHINTLINKTIWHLDKYCCKKACLVWNISSRIPDARERLMNFNRSRYGHTLVPLTYSKDLLRFKGLGEIDKDSLVFVGTLSWNQGLQLVIESMPDLLKTRPELKVHIIGTGHSADGINQIIATRGLSNRFIFHGFIDKDEDVFDIVSRCAIGICPWTDEVDNNAIYADPGKPKLYAFCGIPIIITNVTAVAQEIDDQGAGIAINYNKHEFVNAVLKILKDERTLEKFKRNAHNFANKYTTEAVFGLVSKEVIDSIENNGSSLK